jgi:hypothetical protein
MRVFLCTRTQRKKKIMFGCSFRRDQNHNNYWIIFENWVTLIKRICNEFTRSFCKPVSLLNTIFLIALKYKKEQVKCLPKIYSVFLFYGSTARVDLKKSFPFYFFPQCCDLPYNKRISIFTPVKFYEIEACRGEFVEHLSWT